MAFGRCSPSLCFRQRRSPHSFRSPTLFPSPMPDRNQIWQDLNMDGCGGVGSAAFVAGTLVAGHAADRYGFSVIMWLSAAALLALPFGAKFVPAFPEGSGARLLHQERPDPPWLLLLRLRTF